MGLRLSSVELDHFVHLSEVLLAPLAHPGVDAWRAEVNCALLGLFPADHAIFQLAGQPRLFAAQGVDDAVLDRLQGYVAAEPAGLRYRRPELQRLYERRVAHPDEVFTRVGNERLLGISLRDTEMYSAVCLPAGMVEFHGLHTRTPQGDAMLFVSSERPHRGMGQGAVPLLRALLPAFRAGLQALARAAAPLAPTPAELRERYGLTAREAEVAVLLAGGATEKRIAAALGISPHTARHHTERVFVRLGVRSRRDAALRILHPAR